MFFAKWVGCVRGSLQRGESIQYEHVGLFYLLTILKVVTSNINITHAIWSNLLHEC
jgi:hypothetical protein